MPVSARDALATTSLANRTAAFLSAAPKAKASQMNGFAHALAAVQTAGGAGAARQTAATAPAGRPQLLSGEASLALQAGTEAEAATPERQNVQQALVPPIERMKQAFQPLIRSAWRAAGTEPPADASVQDLVRGPFDSIPAAGFAARHGIDMGSFDPVVRDPMGNASIGADGEPVTWMFRDLGDNRYALTDPTGLIGPWTMVYDLDAMTMQPVDKSFGSVRPIMTTDMTHAEKFKLQIAYDLAGRFGVTPGEVLANLTPENTFKQDPATLWKKA